MIAADPGSPLALSPLPSRTARIGPSFGRLLLWPSRPLRLLAAALSVTLACSNPTEPPGAKNQSPLVTSRSSGAPGRSLSAIADQFKQLSEVAPGFTGVFFDENGDLTISVATDSFSAESRERVVSWARSFSATAATKTTAQLRRVEFSYAALSENYDRLLSALQPGDGVNMTYIDETEGFIGIGLASLSKVGNLQGRLDSLGVPARMVRFERSQVGVPQTTLNQKYRPLIGGLQVQHHSITTSCSLGFNVFRRGVDGYSPDPSLGRYFFTAAHCSGTWGVPNGQHVYQPSTSASNRIGFEYEVAPKKVYPNCPSPAQSPCLVADVMVVSVHDTVTWSYGRVADVDGSKNIIGTFNLQGATTYGGLNGETITLVGATSGKRTSTIQNTCVHRTFPDPIAGGSMTILCMQESSYVAGDGDSGGPIFIPYNGNWDTPRVVGIHMGTAINGQGQSRKYFSPITQIEYALPTLYYWF